MAAFPPCNTRPLATRSEPSLGKHSLPPGRAPPDFPTHAPCSPAHGLCHLSMSSQPSPVGPLSCSPPETFLSHTGSLLADLWDKRSHSWSLHPLLAIGAPTQFSMQPNLPLLSSRLKCYLAREALQNLLSRISNAFPAPPGPLDPVLCIFPEPLSHFSTPSHSWMASLMTRIPSLEHKSMRRLMEQLK